MHKILEFKQSAWMKPYIDFNSEKRKETTNEADKNLFKLLNNAVKYAFKVCESEMLNGKL